MDYTPPKSYTKDALSSGKQSVEPQSAINPHQRIRNNNEYNKQFQAVTSPYREQESIDYTYEQSFREAQRRAEEAYEQQIQNLETDKINLIKRQEYLN